MKKPDFPANLISISVPESDILALLWHESLQPLAPCAPAMDQNHVGFGPCFVDEHQSRGIDLVLIILPPLAPFGDVLCFCSAACMVSFEAPAMSHEGILSGRS